MSVVQRRGGRVPGAEGYHKEDLRALLACVKTVLPTTTDEWDLVLEEYRATHAVPNERAQRDTHSLKMKFKQLLKSNPAEGKSRAELIEAQAIQKAIEAKRADGDRLQRRGGRIRGAEGFSKADSQAVLACIQKILPVRTGEWEQALEEYRSTYATPNDRAVRDVSSLKNKFRQWLKLEQPAGTSRVEVEEARAIQAQIDAKMGSSEGDGQEAKSAEAEVAKSAGREQRRGGRPPGSEGYSKSDMKALLGCIKEVQPAGPCGWEQALQRYRSSYATPNSRSQRDVSSIKSKFKQLVNSKQGIGKAVREEVREARAVQMEIELNLKLGRNVNNGAEALSVHAAEANSHERLSLLSRPDAPSLEKLEEQNLISEPTTESPTIPQETSTKALGKRSRDESDVRVETTSVAFASEGLRSEIASRELQLLKQREQREVDVAAWEKERAQRERQRIDLEAWTFVCDRLRALYREQTTERNPAIVGEIDEEIRLLKQKKQRLADSL
ncbi:hypothetical protein BBJ28_00018341 [Nothophytophthora sp. Chile5]|nr:hypothetical protein BBJ28_00018341 [Nothophytophthora sp. Chile5]